MEKAARSERRSGRRDQRHSNRRDVNVWLLAVRFSSVFVQINYDRSGPATTRRRPRARAARAPSMTRVARAACVEVEPSRGSTAL